MGDDPHGHGHDEGGDGGEGGADEHHEREGAGKGEQGDEQVFGAVMGDLADVGEVGGDPADQVTGLLAVVEAQGERLQVVEGAAAHLRLDADAEDVAPIVDHRE